MIYSAVPKVMQQDGGKQCACWLQTAILILKLRMKTNSCRSIFCDITTASQNCFNSSWNWIIKVLNIICRQVLPDVSYLTLQVIDSSNAVNFILQLSLQSMPNIFDDVQIWWLFRPRYCLYFIFLPIFHDRTGSVNQSVFVLEATVVLREMLNNH